MRPKRVVGGTQHARPSPTKYQNILAIQCMKTYSCTLRTFLRPQNRRRNFFSLNCTTILYFNVEMSILSHVLWSSSGWKGNDLKKTVLSSHGFSTKKPRRKQQMRDGQQNTENVRYLWYDAQWMNTTSWERTGDLFLHFRVHCAPRWWHSYHQYWVLVCQWQMVVRYACSLRC